MSTRHVFNHAELHELLSSPDGGLARDLKRRGVKVQRAVKRSLHQAGTGRAYTHGNVTHVASAPGQPPATDTGRLAASIAEELGRDSTSLVERIGTNVEYALPLEYGSRTMAARPFLRPGLRAASDRASA